MMTVLLCQTLNDRSCSWKPRLMTTLEVQCRQQDPHEGHRDHNLCTPRLHRHRHLLKQSTQPPPPRATATQIEPDDGHLRSSTNRADGCENASKGHFFRTEDLLKAPAPAASACLRAQRPMIALTLPQRAPSLGARTASSSADQAWKPQKGCYLVSSGWNYLLPTLVSPVGRRGPGWGRSADGWQVNDGTQYSAPPGNTLLPIASKPGRTGNFKRRTRGAPGEGLRIRDCRRAASQLARPRSLCTCRFQPLKTSHPYGPSLHNRPKCPKCPNSLLRPPPKEVQHRTASGADPCAKPASPSEGATHRRQHNAHLSPPRQCSLRPQTQRHLRLSTPASQSGPKSGSYLVLILRISLIAPVGGVRVPLDSASGGGPAATAAGKHRGPAPIMASVHPTQHPVTKIAQSMKRAYRRARLRAQASPNLGTWYKGRWHTLESLGQLPKQTQRNHRRARPQPSSWRRQVPHLRVLSWNASGLSSALFQELIAWCDLQSNIDIIIIQETHWHATSDFCTGPWQAIHSSGRDAPDGFGRCSGLLFLLHRSKFQDPRVSEIIPGRLALVQATSRLTRLPISILGIYQHVWRSGLSTAKNQELRRDLWHQLDRTLLTIPQRHHLLVCGDFNTAVSPSPPEIGHSVPPDQTNQDSSLLTLLQKHSLCILNTWHARPNGTYFSPSGFTQIDYVITRQATANLQAKRAYPDHAFPVEGGRLTGHYPVRAQLPMQSFGHRSAQAAAGAPANAAIDLAALQTAVSQAQPQALAMQAKIAARLVHVDVHNLTSAHRHLNRILQEEAAAAFPKQPPEDNRVSARPEFRLTARHVWHLYHELKQPRVSTAYAVFAKWRLATQFAQASRALRQQSRLLKRQYYESQVDQAELAACRGDQRSLYLIVRRLSPRVRQSARRLRGDDGRLLSCQEELQHIAAYGNQTFAAKQDDHPIAPLAQSVCITDEELRDELHKLGVAKAVPSHIAPTAVWRQCSTEVSCVLGQALRVHLTSGRTGQLDEDWKNCYMVWIPKPNKPAGDVASLRPIGLSSPAGKALAGSLRHHLLRGLEPVMRFMPQFAYARNRGTADALIRAHAHFEAVSQLLLDTQCTRFRKQAGGSSRKCVGGLSLSLDLSSTESPVHTFTARWNSAESHQK